MASYDSTEAGFAGMAGGAAGATPSVAPFVASSVASVASPDAGPGPAGDGSTSAYAGIGTVSLSPLIDRPTSQPGTCVTGTPCARARPSTSR